MQRITGISNVYDDALLRDAIGMPEAIEVMREAFRAAAEGTLVAPARQLLEVGKGGLVFTMGGECARRRVAGFRVYDCVAPNAPDHVQLVVVYDSETGAFKGAVIGRWVGDMRTGAIGGVAVDALASADAVCLGVVGCGNQARTQLQAAAAVRRFETVRVFSRDEQRRRRFAEEMSQVVGRRVQPVPSAREAVDQADVVITATTSIGPVVRTEWLKPGVHLNLVGPKFRDACEIDLEIVERAGLFVTDSLAQAEAAGKRFLLAGTPRAAHLVDLAELVAGRHTGRSSNDELTVFISLGLAGTEVLLADVLLQRAGGTG
jgi:ornithine cyclodeaminase/alanine dehydrogenase-like protein (mu-crystallin family)